MLVSRQLDPVTAATMEQISYLGCAKIENPSSEVEILKIMQLLNKERSEKPIDVILFIPDSSSGIVRFVFIYCDILSTVHKMF
ncbi:unnamed protein product [Wuchereria bancrofti]|uniref:Uncharacterized protein n=1 Tax=Wuchereria bancrofti TaxID=6293 RepID=A0A3P7DY24_WUCBA|nr:unnamed protein product [Wuchereria bancrofti]